MERTLLSIRVDDIPLLHKIIGDLGVKAAVDEVLPVHGNWLGSSIGTITQCWLCYILSQCDHRLQNVQGWSCGVIDLLGALEGDLTINELDFTDDKLGILLEKLGESASWSKIEEQINKNSLSVYRLGSVDCVATFRLDAAPMQSHGQVEEGGLLQHGYHKQHADLPQFKVKLCTLDNELNHFAYPITHLTVSGNRSDDELYIPVIKQSKQVLRGISGYERGNLYVGDSKFGSVGNRAYVVSGGDYYLMPLSLTQLSEKERAGLIKASDRSNYTPVIREKGKEKERIAEGFELLQELAYERANEASKSLSESSQCHWTERRLFVHGTSYAKAQQAAFDNRLSKAVAKIEDLPTRKQGKANLQSYEAYQEAIANVLKENSLEDFLDVKIQSTQNIKELRAYGKKPARTEVTQTFELQITKNENAIEEHKTLLGWQVYATNAPSELLSFEACVLKYRHQSNIEHEFDNLRNKVAHLVPVYLQKDERIKGLVNLLMLALKVCAVLEYTMAQALSKNEEELYQTYEGNPKRGTQKPSTKRMLNVFKGITIAVIFLNHNFQFAIMSQLQPVQLRILELLGMDKEVYTDLTDKIQISFLEKIISET
jgi:transposase